MPRYIDADALMKRLNRKEAGPHDRKYTEGFNDALARFRSMVHSAPTVSPDEVRGVGKWITARTWEHDGDPYCSLCGFENCYTTNSKDFNYCPNCGAKMEVSEDA